MRLIKHTKQGGFVAAYIMYGIALMAMVGAAYGKIHSNNEQARVVQDSVEEVVAQVDTLRSKIFLCASTYPDGDHLEFEARRAFPAPPATNNNKAAISDVTCPGIPSGSKSLARVGDGVPLPLAPAEFQPWIYEHTLDDGIRLRLKPKVEGGAKQIRARLLRKLGSIATAESDEIVISILH